MPIYEYRCTKCQRVIEAIQKFDDPPLTTCEVCSGSLEKLISRSAFTLKGGGWFQGGYSKGSGGSDSGSKSESKSDAGGKDSGSDGKTKNEASVAGGGSPSGGGCGSGSCGCH